VDPDVSTKAGHFREQKRGPTVSTSIRTERGTATSSPAQTRRAPSAGRRRDDTRLALLFIAPALVGFLAFYIWPLLRGIYLSFTKFNLLTPPEFNGLTNYVRMVHDPVFWNALVVTLEYVVINIGLQTVLALVIAVMMQRLTRKTWLHSIVLTPYLVSNVVAAMLFLWILDYQLGIGNNILAALHLGRIPFLSSSAWAIPTIALINVWRHVGYTALLIFAGLQTIPEYVYEAARVDGASEFRMFRSITVPLLRPILALVLIISIIGSFQVFDTVAITTQGGPVNSTRVLQYYIYDMAFSRFQFGYASTLAVALLVVLVAISFAQYRLTRAGSTDLD
jgi:multiple sugar transport system permease protein